MTTDTQLPVENFDDIRPYDDHQFREKIRKLVKEPGFEHAVRYVMPGVDYPAFVENLVSVESQEHFQKRVMGPFLEMLVAKTTDGLTVDVWIITTPEKAILSSPTIATLFWTPRSSTCALSATICLLPRWL